MNLTKFSQEQKYLKVNVISVIAISLLVTLGFGAINLIVPYYILALKGTLKNLPERLEVIHAERAVVEIGAMSSSFMLTRALFAAMSGWLSDKFGRRRMIVLGMIVYTFLGVLYAMTTSPWQLIALRAVQGVASALVWPVAEALLVDSVSPDLRTRALSVYVMMMNVGQVIGPAIGSIAYGASKRLLEGSSVATIFRAPFILITITTFPGIIFALIIRETRGTTSVIGEENTFKLFKGEYTRLPRSVKRALLSFYISGLFNGLAAGIVSSIMMVYVIDFIAKEPEKVGMALSISGLAGLIMAYPAAHVADALSEKRKKDMLIITYLVARVLLASVGFIRSYWIFVVVVSMLNITMNISMPLLRTIQASLVPSCIRGKVFGLQQAFFNTGMIIGPLLGAYIYKYYFNKVLIDNISGIQAAFIISSFLGILGVLLIVIYYRPETVRDEWKSVNIR